MTVIVQIANKNKTSTKRARVEGVSNYIWKPEDINKHEKCTYAFALNFLSNIPETQIAEMLALAEQAVRCKDPIDADLGDCSIDNSRAKISHMVSVS